MTTRAYLSRRLIDAACWLGLVAGAVVMIFPIYWMFATAVRPHAEIFEAMARLVPSSFSWSNFHAVLTRYPVLTWVNNSVIIAVVAVVLTVFINLLCGYTFAKFRFPGRNILFFAILGALMVPIQVILVPEFLIVSWLGLLNTHLGVILPRAAEAFGIFMVRQFMVSIPDELIEAAPGWRGRVRDLLAHRSAAVQADHRCAGDLYLHVALERFRLASGRADGSGHVHHPARPQSAARRGEPGLGQCHGPGAVVAHADAGHLPGLPASPGSGDCEHGTEIVERSH
jgi:hypothetical protein